MTENTAPTMDSPLTERVVWLNDQGIDWRNDPFVKTALDEVVAYLRRNAATYRKSAEALIDKGNTAMGGSMLAVAITGEEIAKEIENGSYRDHPSH